jgi:hypothetical protein
LLLTHIYLPSPTRRTKAKQDLITLAALINYRWSRNPGALLNPVEKAIAALIAAICWGSAAWYKKNGLRESGAVVGLAGALQAYAAFFSTA